VSTIVASVYQNPSVTASDRLGLTLFMAVILHAVIILGVTFSPTDKDKDKLQSIMEITLVHQKSEHAPDKADLLAQVNLEGGGNTEEKIRPTSPTSQPVDRTDATLSTPLDLTTSPQQQQHDTPAVLTQLNQTQKTPPEHNPETEQANMDNTTSTLMRSMEIANLSAEIDQSLQAYSQRLKHRYISSQTREYRDAAYLDAWRMKIERIGTLNYPEEAKRQNLSGSLILDVALNADGKVNNITLRRSSGYKILDDAAIRIVKLAAPFAPFPDALRQDTDVLHITRTWQFLSNHQFQAGQ
jgi:periplasmic protein TonB